ncbi:hypothetical protein [Treponema sp.]|uniref:hypothetical protein n=1 Tax=Treponema sp. TaxID=166 RepID=UPI00298D6CAF|nr:hypothetical protein [Treponema sp.]MCR5614367.1 hypothetical protein [Treponema sp.]
MIPQLLLEQILLGEKKAEDYYKKYGREELDKALAELKNSNEEILAQYPVSQMQKEFIKKTLVVKKTSNFNIVRLSYAAAAALVLCLSVPLVINTLNSKNDTATTRLKGRNASEHQLHLYKQVSDGAVLLKDGSEASERDVIQITYIPGYKNYGVIFSVDGKGNVTRHFPENSWKAEKLEKTGSEVPLEFSYKLDDAPKYECFIFVASKKPFDMRSIENIDKKVYSVEYLKQGKYLPAECDGSIFVLNKK